MFLFHLLSLVGCIIHFPIQSWKFCQQNICWDWQFTREYNYGWYSYWFFWDALAMQTDQSLWKHEQISRNGINKLVKNRIRLQYRTPEQAQSLHKVDWNTAFDGLTPYKRKYAIVIHGVPKTDVNFDELGKIDATIKELEKANISRGLPITRIAPLKRKATVNKSSLSHSIIVFTEDPKAADTCIKLSFYVNYQCYSAERYLPHLYIIQCYKCYDYGHRASQCHHHKQKCSNCGTHSHDVTECTTIDPSCALCHGDHHPWAKTCPERVAENQRLEELRMKTSPYFTS